MISSDVEAAQAPRSLADNMSDLSQHYHDHDGHYQRNQSLETSSQKVTATQQRMHQTAKMTPAANKFSTMIPSYSGPDLDTNSVAMTAKPNQVYRKQSPHTKNAAYLQKTQHKYTFVPRKASHTLVTKQSELSKVARANQKAYQPTRFVEQMVMKDKSYPVALTSKAEMDLQLRDLEYKIGTSDRKYNETCSELRA